MILPANGCGSGVGTGPPGDGTMTMWVSVPITCLAPPSVACAGDVLIVTAGKFQPAAGGPLGRLRLLFQFVQVPGGHTVSVHGNVSRAAEGLGLERSHLYRKMKALGVSVKE